MTRDDRDSLVEMLAKIPVTETKGSLLSAIAKLLRVIDVSENSVMIPTLLKDKCEFDAYEMLTLGKVLKASILGHNDLVEFYMSESSSHSFNTQLAHHQHLNGFNSSNHNNNYNHNNHNINVHSSNSKHQLNHLSPVHQLSATPSLRSSASESTSSSPSTPMPSAELIGRSSQQLKQQLGTNGNPETTVRLLLQIEQLKIFIPHVTGIFESIIELYKNSVDTI